MAKDNKLDRAILPHTARRIYDFLGKTYDWFGGFDARAKTRAIELLELAPGDRVLEVGVGTGKVLSQINQGITPRGLSFGIDLSSKMLSEARRRNQSPLCQADARNTPIVSDRFDRIFISYVLDLVAMADIPAILLEMMRVLKPGGRMVIVALTEGINLPSRALISIWKAAYSVSPVVCAGCRPLQLSSMLQNAGLSIIYREVVVQLAVPSEILAAVNERIE